ECYTAAIRRDPGFALAHLNRGLARLDLKQFQAALDDLDRAAALGREDAILHAGRGAALEGLGKHRQADDALAAMESRARALPDNLRVPLLLRHGFTVYKRLPGQADGSFAAVLRHQPHHPQALYGRAMLLVEQKQEAEAVACFDKALEHHPGFT